MHATTQRVVNEAFAEEKPHLKALPLAPFRSVLKLERRVSHEGMVSVGGIALPWGGHVCPWHILQPLPWCRTPMIGAPFPHLWHRRGMFPRSVFRVVPFRPNTSGHGTSAIRLHPGSVQQ